MRSEDDRELQDRAQRPETGDDRELPPAEREEVALYRELFAILGEEPDFELPPDFAARVADRVRRQAEPTTDWLPLVATLLLGGGFVVGVPAARTAVADAIALTAGLLPLQIVGALSAAALAVHLLDRLLARSQFPSPG